MTPVRAYHAHVYFDAAQRGRAVRLRQELGRRFAVRIGGMHDRPVGPHPQAMFQAVFAAADFGRVVPWLMQHRDGLDVLVHPDTGDDLADHRDRALWLGRSLRLDLDTLVLEAQAG